MNTDIIRDDILRKLDSIDDYFGANYYDLHKDIGYNQKEISACLSDLEEREYVKYPAEGKISITDIGTFFINSTSFTEITKNKVNQDLYEKNRDTKTHKVNISNVIIVMVGIFISASISLYGNKDNTEFTTKEIAKANAKVDSLAKEILSLKNSKTIANPIQYESNKQTLFPDSSVIK